MRRGVCVGVALGLVGMVTGCGGVPASPSAAVSAHHAAAPSTNPFHGLQTGAIRQLAQDLTFLRRAAGSAVGAENLWWTDGNLSPQTATLQAQETQAVTIMSTALVAIPGNARGVLDDIQGLPKPDQARFASLKVAAEALIRTDHTFSVDTTTPWSGPGSTPSVTKAVVGKRLNRDTTTMVKANVVVAKYAIEAQMALAATMSP